MSERKKKIKSEKLIKLKKLNMKWEKKFLNVFAIKKKKLFKKVI